MISDCINRGNRNTIVSFSGNISHQAYCIK